MAKNVVVQIVDDIDGGEASDTVSFGLDGRPTRSTSMPKIPQRCERLSLQIS
jgi:hypothetical protein